MKKLSFSNMLLAAGIYLFLIASYLLFISIVTNLPQPDFITFLLNDFMYIFIGVNIYKVLFISGVILIIISVILLSSILTRRI